MSELGTPNAIEGERHRRFRRFLIAGFSIAVAFLVVTAALVWLVLTSHAPERCGPIVNGSPMHFTNVVRGGLTDNLTASWKAECVTEEFQDVSHIKIRLFMDDHALTPDNQSLRFDRAIGFGLTVKVIVRDEDGDDRLNSGDSFSIFGLSGSHSWRFYLYWDDGIVTGVAWYTP